MSLLVWLPMTKDLTQQGLSDITVTNNGTTLNTNGKLGKCYYFDGNAHYLQFSKSVGDLYSGDFSYAVWLKPTDDTRSIICSEYAATGESGIAFELTASRQIRLYWNGSPDIYATGCVLPKDVWTHCAITRSGNVAKFYINGVLTYTYQGTLANRTSTAKIRLGDDYRGGTSVTYMGYMNDFRLYDHALSPREIEILSRGLVAHYPLNGGGRGGDNLLKNSNFLQGTGGLEGYTVTGATCTKQSDCMKIVSNGTTSGIFTGNYTSITTGAMCTFSAYVKSDSAMTLYIGADGSGIGNCQAYTIGDSWQKISISKAKTENNAYLRLYGKGTFYAKLLKYELGSTATPWIPNSADTAYTAMGYNSTTEYDVSGYGNNMTKTGTITYATDSIRYNVASHFINGSYIIATKNCPDYLPTDGVTVNLWVKPTTWANPISCTESGGWNFEGSTIQFVCYISGVGYKAAVSGVTGASLQDGKWHMLTGTYDRIAQEVKIYVDGILKTTTATGSSNNIGYASNRLVISGEAGGGTPASSAFVGEESDVRIYATALSATQVAELYNTAVSVANNGTLMGYELVEG